jgi:hypothetical protein
MKQWTTFFLIFLIVTIIFYLSSEHPSSFPLDKQYNVSYEYYGYLTGFIAGGSILLLLLCMLITYIPALGTGSLSEKGYHV